MKHFSLTVALILAIFSLALAQTNNQDVFFIKGMRIDATDNPALADALRPLALNGQIFTEAEKSTNETKLGLIKVDTEYDASFPNETELTRDEFSYDGAGRLLSRLSSVKDYQEPISPQSFLEHTYNDQGLTATTVYSYNPNETGLLKASKYETEYDNNNLSNLYKRYSYNQITQTWTLRSKIQDYSYDSENFILASYSYNRDTMTDTWTLGSKTTYTYDSLNIDFRVLTESYDTTTDTWSNSNRFTVYENTTNPQLVADFESWSITTNDWAVTSRNEVYIDSNSKHNPVIRLGASLTTPANTWLYGNKEDRTFDTDGNMITKIETPWSNTTQDWDQMVSQNQFDYNYDFDVPVTELIVPNAYAPSETSGFFQYKLLTNSIGFLSGGIVSPYGTTTYFYQDVLLPIQEQSTLSPVLVYPNPAQESIRFQGINAGQSMQFALFDALGRQLMSAEVQNTTSLPVQHLTDGMYYYTVTNAEGTYSSTLSIKR
jgi:Secretion system C-terminal sorting domain